MGTAVRTAKPSPASWDAFSDVDAFVDGVVTELAAMETNSTKPRSLGHSLPEEGAQSHRHHGSSNGCHSVVLPNKMSHQEEDGAKRYDQQHGIKDPVLSHTCLPCLHGTSNIEPV